MLIMFKTCQNRDKFVVIHFILYSRKPTTRRGKRALLNREPLISENVKIAMFIKGNQSSDTVNKCIKDVVSKGFDN